MKAVAAAAAGGTDAALARLVAERDAATAERDAATAERDAALTECAWLTRMLEEATRQLKLLNLGLLGMPAEMLVRVAQRLSHVDVARFAATCSECRTAAVAAMPTALMNTVVRCCAEDGKIDEAVPSRLPVDLVLPEGIVKVGKGCFEDWKSLHSITLPASVEVVDRCAFMHCTSLVEVVMPGVVGIDTCAFAGCTSLKLVALPTTLEFIGGSAFGSCHSLHLASPVFPASIASIGNMAFKHCSSIAAVDLSDLAATATLGDEAFRLCFSLASVKLHAGLTAIGAFTFNRCRELRSIALPNGLTTVGEGAFSECCALTTVDIPESVESIDEAAFLKCPLLNQPTLARISQAPHRPSGATVRAYAMREMERRHNRQAYLHR